MKRFAVCRVELQQGPTGPEYVPALMRYTQSGSYWYFKTNLWAGVLFAASDLTAIAADPDIYLLPDLTKDVTLSVLSASQRNALKTRLEQVGFLTTVNGQTVLSTSRTWGDALNLIMRQIEPKFDCLAYDIPDVEQ